MGYYQLEVTTNTLYYVNTIEDELWWIIPCVLLVGIPFLILLVVIFVTSCKCRV